MFQKKIVEKFKTCTSCSITFFLNHALYKIIWKNAIRQGWPQMTIWCMHIACWIPKATHSHRSCNNHCLSTATVVAWMRLHVMLCIQCLSCCLFMLILGLSVMNPGSSERQ